MKGVVKDGKSFGMSSCNPLLGSHPTLFPPHFQSPASLPQDTLLSSSPVLPTFPCPLLYPLPVSPEAASPGERVLVGCPRTHCLSWLWF